MSEPFVGEIKMFGGSFAPAGWAFCDGQLQPISENDTLFNLIGTTYGGDGEETFALPNLSGRTPIHMGTGPGLQNYQIGELGGAESVTLTSNTTPIHSHALSTTATGQTASPQNAYFATVSSSVASAVAYTTSAPTTSLVSSSVAPQGGSQPHDNFQPSLGINYIISLFGIYPSQN